MSISASFRARSKSMMSLIMSKQTHYHSLNDVTEPLISECNEAKGETTKVKEEKIGRKRLCNELSRIDYEISECSYGVVDSKDPFKFQGIIIGPCGTPFEGGVFFLSIKVPPNYPYKPPKIKFKTKVFHPNIRSDGTIKIDILGTNWSPVLTIEKLLLSICSFLPDPNHEQDSCNPICDLFWNNRKVYDKIARDWTLKYAML